MIIKQFFDHDEIRRLAYDPKLYVISDANQKGFMAKRQVCKLSTEEISSLLQDEKSMFVTFSREEN